MLTVSWKIGKKPRGRWRTPMQLKVEIEGEELELRPRLDFQKEYDLPITIFLGKTEGVAKEGGIYCKKYNTVDFTIRENFDTPTTLVCRSIFCGSTCTNCRCYLEWRTGKPDYSDVEEVFQRIAEDLKTAWEQAVEEAAASEEYDGDEVKITSLDSVFRKTEKEVLAEKPARKIKI